MANPKKFRSAMARTLYALEHHAAPLKDVALHLFAYSCEKGCNWDSSRGGVNSWAFRDQTGRWFYVRGRRGPWRVEIRRGQNYTTIFTRRDVEKFFASMP